VVSLIYSVRWQLLLSMVAVILVTVGMTAFFANRAAIAEIERMQGGDDVMRARRVSDLVSRSYFRNRSWDGSQGILEHAAELYGQRVVVADQDGRVVADSHSTLTGHRLEQRVRSRARTPVYTPQGRVGTILFGPDLPVEPASAPAAGQEPSGPSLRMLLVFSGLLAVGVAVLLTFFVSRRILSPIESLARVSRQVAKQDFSSRAEVKSRDEVGELARTFNSMVEELSRTQEVRRNLVADVAHELRTPVTNIRGYVEGIADGIIKADADTLESIHGEILLLTRLTEELQDLALAESGQMQLRFQPCDLGNLAYNAATSVQPQVQAKGIILTVEPSPQLLVQADPQRII
jgi:signal transduction histidine kinase